MASARIGGFPRLLPPQVAVALDVHRQLQSFERLAPEAQRKLGASQLDRLARHARHYSPFWSTRLGGPTAVEAGRSLRLAELPVLTRRELQDSFDGMRARAPDWTSDMVRQARTSGSTGRPVCVERLQPLYWPLYAAIALSDARWRQREAAPA